MTNEEFKLSRRKTLAALGSIGVASAGAGLGTSAYFSDEERLDGNSIHAGALDLKIDYQAHYSDWSEDEEVTDDNPDDDPDVRMLAIGEDEGPDERAFPTCADNSVPRVAVDDSEVMDFMRATAQHAAPDMDEDGLVDGGWLDPIDDRDESQWDLDACEDYPDADAIERPVIDLEDVKPGDFGEVTFSTHLCDNPGYLWMFSENVSWAENGETEPESKDAQSAGPADETGSTANGDSLTDAQVELLDAAQACLFYDDGNNLFDTAEDNPACIAFVLDDSGSMAGTKAEETRTGAKAVVDDLVDDDGDTGDDDIDPHEAAVVTFGSGSALQQGLTNDATDLKNAIDEVDGDAGLTNLDAAIDEASTQLSECPEGHQKIMVILSNGAENIGDARTAADDAVTAGNVDTFFTIGVQAGTSGDALLSDIADKSPSGNGVFLDVTNPDQITGAFGQLVQAIGGDREITSGSLRDVLGDLLADPDTGDWGQALDAFPQTMGRDCFPNSDTAYVALEWWLPVDHGNEVQTDSVSFDLGFYTEQCRHNTGDGMARQGISTSTGEGFAKISENFNGDDTISGGTRARYGNNALNGAGELYVGDNPGVSGEFNEAQYQWTSGATVPWTVSYDAANDELTFEFDGTTVSDTLDNPQPDGRFAIQAKADEGTVDASVSSLSIGGSAQTISGSNDVTATNDGPGRDIQYLLFDTALDGSTDVEISGDATVTLQGDYGGGQEGVAFDVVFE